MPRKKPLEIIASGTPKQRIKLLIEDLALERFNRKPILVPEKKIELFETFKSDEEMELFYKWEYLDKLVDSSIIKLQGLRYNVLTNYSNLRGYILVWHTLEESELLINSILHQIEPDERKKILENTLQRNQILFGEAKADNEGYIGMNIDYDETKNQSSPGSKKYKLRVLMNNVKSEAEDSVIHFISWRQALVDMMKKEGFNIKVYKDLLKEITDDVYRPIIGWNKFLSSYEGFLEEDKKERIDKLKSFYSITPNLDKLKVNKDIYDSYVKNHL